MSRQAVDVNRRAITAIAALLALAGCAAEAPTPSEPQIFFPRHASPAGTGDAALLEGRVGFADGCLFVEVADGSRYLVLWPSDTTLGRINSLPAVMGPPDYPVEIGENLRLGGSEADRATAEELVGPIPERCALDGYWAVSTVDHSPL
jgi:hypothetical protein